MEKLYDLKFVYDDESLKTERFTGEFSTDNLPDEIIQKEIAAEGTLLYPVSWIF